MEFLTAGLAGLAFICALIAAWAALRRPAPVIVQDDGFERRLLDSLERARQSLSEALLQTTQAGTQAQGELGMRLTREFGELREATQRLLTEKFQGTGESIRQTLADTRKSQDERLDIFAGALTKSSTELREAQTQGFTRLSTILQERLDKVREDNEAKLEKIRLTVDEKLQSTLEKRLGEQFSLVLGQLEAVHKGLGEMQNLATGVGDLKRVLSNVRARGTFGESQLGALLEQMLTCEQYARNIVTVPQGSEPVEFAIKLPGKDDQGGFVYLPIDAKFPKEDWERLEAAYEAGDVAGIEGSRNALRRRILDEAKTIQSKYICPPHTTDFAILFLATEGLYAEALRIPGLVDELQARHRIVPAGPTTLCAILNALQMGFRTLAIEKRSSEVWRILGAVKTEFVKFGDSLDAVSKKLHEASKKMDDTTRRTRQMERKLREVEALPEGEALDLLPPANVELPEESLVDT